MYSTKMNGKILIVGGTWDKDGGKSSGLVKKFTELLKADTVYNGGCFENLPQILQSVVNYDFVLWWANVPNEYDKIRDVKKVNPKVMLVTSKRNDSEKYSFAELISRSLEQKANLTVEFSKKGSLYNMRLFNPLGVVWYDGQDVEDCANAMKDQLQFLATITRQPSICVGEKVEAPDEKEFFEYIRKCADIFHNLINPAKGTTRFLGNSSFRCQRGFPSFRSSDGIFVSRRNVDKRYIDKDAFVYAYLNEKDQVYYFGDAKPSVDTPVQLRLYRLFPNINYMIHAHCYVKDGFFTNTPIPCGGLEEVEEITRIVYDTNETRYAFNLIGHGCIIMGQTVEDLKSFIFIKRPMPEKLLD